MLCHERIYHTARHAPRRREPDGHTPPLSEIRAHHRQPRAKHHPVGQPAAHALGEKELPVLAALCRHKHAEHLQRRANRVHQAKVAGVGGTPAKHPDKEEEKHLHRPDPADGGALLIEDSTIVGLKDTKGLVGWFAMSVYMSSCVGGAGHTAMMPQEFMTVRWVARTTIQARRPPSGGGGGSFSRRKMSSCCEIAEAATLVCEGFSLYLSIFYLFFHQALKTREYNI